MEFTPSPPALVAAFDAALPLEPDVVRRKMFGWPAAFVGGWMFASLHRDAIVVRLPEPDLADLLALPGAARFEPMPGRPMRGYGTLPRELHDDGEAIRSWIERAYRATASLPPKR